MAVWDTHTVSSLVPKTSAASSTYNDLFYVNSLRFDCLGFFISDSDPDELGECMKVIFSFVSECFSVSSIAACATNMESTPAIGSPSLTTFPYSIDLNSSPFGANT
mmetsp:Transcript_59677/g.71104  ORF Transcript_59677/g.71104 Transcript_59677/m.71104 type:complete len:106 (+) Transcript_59677:138-455(+)